MAKSIAEKPRGVLNLTAGERKFRLSRHPPAHDLAFFVEHYWTVRWDLRGQEPYRQEVLPHPSVHLIIEGDRSSIVGVMRGKFSRVLEENGWVFGVKFRPGAFHPFIAAPVSRFTDRSLALQDAFGTDGPRFAAAMLRLADDDAMIAHAEDFLRERLPERDARVTIINEIVERIEADRTITRVDDLVRQCDVPKRTLQRLFRDYVGVSPKWVIQRYRLHDAAEQLAYGDMVDWPKVALDLGYFDQAHFIKDFKAIVGKAPAAYAKAIRHESAPV